MGHEQGETVNLNFTSTDATTAADVGTYDANGAARTLASNERLIVDTLNSAANLGTNRAEAYFDTDAGSDIDAGEIVASFNGGNGNAVFGAEGFSGPIGKTLKFKASATGQVIVTGTGRIIKGKTAGLRPSWREPLFV